MLQRAQEYMPGLGPMSAVRTWTGFRAATPDKLPLIGPWPGDKSLFLATGHEGLGHHDLSRHSADSRGSDHRNEVRNSDRAVFAVASTEGNRSCLSPVVLTVNGASVAVPRGATVAVAVAIAGQPCRTSVRGEPRGPLCGMGICFECRVSINGKAALPKLPDCVRSRAWT